MNIELLDKQVRTFTYIYFVIACLLIYFIDTDPGVIAVPLVAVLPLWPERRVAIAVRIIYLWAAGLIFLAVLKQYAHPEFSATLLLSFSAYSIITALVVINFIINFMREN